MLNAAELIAFVPTLDPSRSRKFYEDILGLKFISDDGFALVFDVQGTMLRITKVPEFTPMPFTILGWKVADADATAADLASNGILFERFGFLDQDAAGIWTSPNGSRVAWFKDPDGNMLSISQHTTS